MPAVCIQASRDVLRASLLLDYKNILESTAFVQLRPSIGLPDFSGVGWRALGS